MYKPAPVYAWNEDFRFIDLDLLATQAGDAVGNINVVDSEFTNLDWTNQLERISTILKDQDV